jgi:acid phosphatase
MVQAAASKQDMSTWDGFQWRRKMEAFGNNDEAIIATGPGGEIEAIWSVISGHSVE